MYAAPSVHIVPRDCPTDGAKTTAGTPPPLVDILADGGMGGGQSEGDAFCA